MRKESLSPNKLPKLPATYEAKTKKVLFISLNKLMKSLVDSNPLLKSAHFIFVHDS